MLTQLSTVKARLELLDATHDALLTAAITALSARFDKETNRTLARTESPGSHPKGKPAAPAGFWLFISAVVLEKIRRSAFIT